MAVQSERRIMNEGLVFTVEPFLSLGAEWAEDGGESGDAWTLFAQPQSVDRAIRAHRRRNAQRTSGRDITWVSSTVDWLPTFVGMTEVWLPPKSARQRAAHRRRSSNCEAPQSVRNRQTMTKTRTETDTFGPIEVAADRYWGAQAQRSLGNFKIGWEKQPAADRSRARDRQARRRRDQHGARQARPEARRGNRQSGAGGHRGQARRSFPARRLADGLGHAIEHERQRGHLEPRDRNARRRDGLEEARASERPRQHEPVVERHLSDRDAHRLLRRDRPSAAARAAEAAQRR